MDKIEQLQDLIDRSQKIVFSEEQVSPPSQISLIFVVQMVFIILN